MSCCTWQLIGSLNLGYQLVYRELLYMATSWFSQSRLSARIPWVAVHGNCLVRSISVINAYTVRCCTWQLIGSLSLGYQLIYRELLYIWQLIGSLSLGYQLIYRELLYMTTDWFSQSRLSTRIPCCCIRQLIGSLDLGYQLIYRGLLYMATDWFFQSRLSAHIPCCHTWKLIVPSVAENLELEAKFRSV